MKALKWSTFVSAFEVPGPGGEDNCILFCSLNRATYEVPAEVKRRIDAYLAGKSPVEEELKDVIARFYRNKLIVSRETDEARAFEKYRYDYYHNVFGTVVYFVPTWSCNFTCPYCIQPSTVHDAAAGSYMNKATARQSARWTLEFMQERKAQILGCREKNPKSHVLRVVFFGGEPSLAHDINLEFLEAIAAEKPDWIEYEGSMITNGYRFDPQMIGDLLRHNIDSLQITLDGPPPVHDARRRTVSGKGSFHTILENLKKNKALGMKGNVRVNVDDNNIDHMEELIDILIREKLDDTYSLSLSPVDCWAGCDGEAGHTDYTLKKFHRLYRYARSRGFELSLWETFCGVYATSFFTIAPNGKLYKCPSICGVPDQEVGTVFEKEFYPRFRDYVDRDIRPGCKRCAWAGICGGGCYYQNYLVDPGADRLQCFSRTYNELVKAYCTTNYLKRT